MYTVIPHLPAGEQKISLLDITSPTDSLSILQEIQNIRSQGMTQGYSLISVDSLVWRTDECHIYWYLGDKYEVVNLDLDEDTRQIVALSGLENFKWSGKTVDSVLVQSYMSKVILYLSRHGYPFATTGLSNIDFDRGKISASLGVDKGPLITYDEIEVTGDVKIAKAYIEKYTEITPGAAYNHNKVLNLKKNINSLQFLEFGNDPQVKFVNRKARILMPLKERKASRFDFIIGVLPTIEDGRRVWNVNGEFSADFVNKLGRGELFSLELKRLEVNDQLFRSRFAYPYLFNSSFGVDASFELKNNRNISIDLNSEVGGQYIINGNSYLKLTWNYKSSGLVGLDTARLLQLKELPTNLDFNFRGGGIEYLRRALDYRFNPRKGNEAIFRMNLGLRRIVRNRGLEAASTDDVDFVALYNNLKLSNLQMEFSGEVNQYFPVSTFGALKTSVRSKYIFNDGELLINELYRIGGNRIMRGFDELSFQTDLYAVMSAEMRIILDQNSYLSFPFIDVGRIRTRVERETSMETAIGLGLGMNFATPAGIFNVSFAAGGLAGTGIDFANTKIHFGYVSIF